ncbi:response regulator transcription factor [Clostridium tertium]|jgi:DNA-binding response OmpR family regulator|uniref:response regulator transcription factor n=1 Tax=Clostridium TaxID=1485 RepID=UPI000BE317FE|nr:MULTISPECIES: response regulator transcription factor [Clostridium]MBP1867904.1 DNA-binding response OmpR family regulator [Clostridium tertium]MBS5307905.1 response regulator transcription factor [Clostridium sp.]MBU6136045.1 response regulator transcription factor [Clostridium tertium]MDB1921305.1 response regulator transcription factor [Clostridium tertium]MDB1924550.1 response regulator transcription factor [Clostridium tertium]
MSNILIIEDEESVANVLKAYLEKDKYNVSVCNSGMEALEVFKEIDFQLVILDLMLPDIDGEEICKIIRRTSDVYIFMLTSKASLNDRIVGLDIGADEYLIKPFSPRELTARVNALFRRINTSEKISDIFNDGILKIDYEKRIVELRGEEISFTPSEFDILYTLLINKGKVLSREQLIEIVFGIDFDGYDRTIDVHIKNIRKKIEEDTKNPKYIITVTKVGYKFGGDI